jgi:predicted aldo/keto reductase-like oxidoreductase
MPRIRTVEYLISTLDDALTDHGFTVYEGRSSRAADCWQCNVCEQQAEDPNELEHAKECFIGNIAEILHNAWVERARI